MIPDSKADMLRNKERVIETILSDLSACDRNYAAFEKLEALLEQGKQVDPERVVKACAKSLRHTNDINRKLLMILLVYVSGSDYSSDCGHVLVKLGHGQEALQEMIRAKMGGNWQ